jgi:hypothetical protein
MAGWAEDLAKQILASETHTTEAWEKLSEVLNDAVTQITEGLKGNPPPTLIVKPPLTVIIKGGTDTLTVSSSRGRDIIFSLYKTEKLITVLFSWEQSRAVYRFGITNDSALLQVNSGPFIPGLTAEKNMVKTQALVETTIKQLINLR